jgi:hypothetical protein
MSKRVDIAWMLRTGRARPGSLISGTLHWTCGDCPAGSISYEADMRDQYGSELRLSFTRGDGADREHVKQSVRMVFTEPNYGGRRWWLVCPYRNNRCGKLYLPNGGDRFAGRRAWKLGYNSQRVAQRDRVFEKLFRLQRKLGSDEGWEAGLRRPKGMWNRTYERHVERYLDLDERCAAEMMGLVLRLAGERR